MPKFQFNKLVRNKIIDHQKASGAQPTYRILDANAHKEALVQKVIEEAEETLHATETDIASEVADIQQALDDLKKQYNLSNAAVRRAQDKKNEQNGDFGEGIFIEYIELKEDDPWVQYYRQNPRRYPEVR